MNGRRYWKWYFIAPAALVAAPVIIGIFILVGGGIVMLLWNWLLPPLFGLPAITLLQGFGLLVLCRILFGGFGRGGGHSKNMTPEERRRMRERFCGPSGVSQDATTSADASSPRISQSSANPGDGRVQ